MTAFDSDNYFHVVCDTCWAHGPEANTKDMSCALWNARAP